MDLSELESLDILKSTAATHISSYRKDQTCTTPEQLFVFHRAKNALSFSLIPNQIYFQTLLVDQTHIKFFISESQRAPTENISNEFTDATVSNYSNKLMTLMGKEELQKGQNWKKTLHTHLETLKKGKEQTVIIVDEIQKSPELAKELIIACYNYFASSSLRVILTGTSTYGSSEVITIDNDLREKCLHLELLPSLSVIEMCKIIRVLDWNEDIADTIVRLWTSTGGIVRLLRRMLGKATNKTDPIETSLCLNEIEYMRCAVESYSSANEIKILKKIAFTGKKGVDSLSKNDGPVLDKMRRKGMIEQCVGSLQDFEKGAAKSWYTITNALLYVMYRSNVNPGRNEPENAHLHKYCGAGFENCFSSLLDIWNVNLVLDFVKVDGTEYPALDIGQYTPVKIAYGR